MMISTLDTLQELSSFTLEETLKFGVPFLDLV